MAEELPLPQEGSFDALFKPSQIGVEDGFAVPSDHKFTQAAKIAVQREKNELDLINKRGFKLNNLDRELHSRMYGFDSNMIGDRIPTILDESEYMLSMWKPTVGDTFKSAVRQYHVGPALARLLNSVTDPRMKPVEGYSAFNDPILKRYVGEDGLHFFKHSGSHYQSMEKLRRMNIDRRDMRVIEESKHGGLFSMGVSLATPAIFAPIAPVKIMRAGPLRRFFGGAAFTYMMTAGQQGLIETQNEARDATHTAMALTAGAFLGGTLAVAYGRNLSPELMAQYRKDRQSFRENVLNQKPTKEAEYERSPKSAGASANPEVVRERAYKQIEMEGLETTNIGIEKLGWNPVFRMLNSDNPFVRNLAVGMVDVGGLMQKKVRAADIEMEQSVESHFRVNYLPRLLDSARSIDEAYLKYRNKAIPETDIGRAATMMKMHVGDIFTRNGDTLTEVQFRQRVGMAMRTGDVDRFDDIVSPFVSQAASSVRPLFNYIKQQGEQVGLFTKELEKDLAKAQRANNLEEITRIEKQIKKIQEQGVMTNTAESYLPRVYRVDKIEANPQRFLTVVRNYLIHTKKMKAKEADAMSLEILDTVTRRRPYFDLEGADDSLDFVKNASGAHARSFEIPDELIEEFLENDIETILRHHVKTMGMDIELTRRFGSIDMEDVIVSTRNEYQRLIDETADIAKRTELAKAMERDITDIRGLRDRLRGTYGASKDPHSMSSRFVRVMKSFNVLTMMGSAMISSVPDVARIVMVEGFDAAYKNGFATLFNESARRLRTMNKSELDKAAIAVDATLGLRAHAMSDMGDLFGNRYALERSLNDASGMFFFFNGMNIWNQTLKEITGNVTALRMTESIMKKGGWRTLPKAEKEKLLKNGIGENDYNIMRKEIRANGKKEGNEWLPNTDGWSDANQRLKFRIALNQNVERIIITPGAGDRALWTSTELGSLITQFKSFGQGAMTRMLTSGLQEKDGAFWQGAFLIVGLAAIVNEAKRAQYGITSEETADEKLLNAIDRSGILGWFMDVNNSIEKVSDYKIGMRPFLTEQQSYPVNARSKASAVLGPAASTTHNFFSVLGDIIKDEVDEQTLRDTRFLFPSGNTFYLDPVYDGVFGGNVNRQLPDNRG